MAVGYNPSIIADDLLVYIDAANTRSYPGSGTTLFDLSGKGVNATLVGSPAFGGSYFTISSDSTYITMPNSTLNPGTANFTYSMWVWFTSVDSADTLVENGSWTDTLLLRVQTNIVAVYAEGVLVGTISWTPTSGRWTNVVFVRSSGVLSMYINGVLTGTPLTMTTDIVLTNPNLWLMRSQHTTGQWTNGRIATFSIHGSALTPDQILDNFVALRGRFGV